MPPQHLFEDASTSLPFLSRAALDVLDRATMAFHRRTRAAAGSSDVTARAAIASVQGECTRLWPSAKVCPFGSRATGLAIATSDLDLVITGVPGLPGPSTEANGSTRNSTDSADAALGAHGVGFDAQIDQLKALLPRIAALSDVSAAIIKKSAIPVIAFQVRVDSTAEATPLDGGTGPGASPGPGTGDKEERSSEHATSSTSTTTLCIDVSICTHRHRGLLAAQHVRWLHAQLPHLSPLTVLIKALLHTHGLGTPFTGGLSSYALTILVCRFILDRPRLRCARAAPTGSLGGFPHEPQPGQGVASVGTDSSITTAAGAPSVGLLLIEFLAFCGQIFEPGRHVVLGGCGGMGVPQPGSGFCLREHLAPLVTHWSAGRGGAEAPFANDPLVCVDAVDVLNNVGKTCYRIGQVQQLLARAATTLACAAEMEAKGVTPPGEPAESGPAMPSVLRGVFDTGVIEG